MPSLLIQVVARKGKIKRQLIRGIKSQSAADFPGGSVVKNLPVKAEDTGSHPWSWKIPRALGQLSLCSTTTKVRAS